MTGPRLRPDKRSARPLRRTTCRCCRLPPDVRARLEMLRLSGVSWHSLSREFSTKEAPISNKAIQRHFDSGHVSDKRKFELLAGPARVNELAEKAAAESRSLVDYLSIARGVLFNQFLAAAEASDRHGVAFVGSRLLDALRDLARLTGQLRELGGISIVNNNLTVISSPVWTDLADEMIGVCRQFPEARAAILEAMRRVEAKNSPSVPDGGVPSETRAERAVPSSILIEAEAVHAD
jgi:hypothetical protein